MLYEIDFPVFSSHIWG